MKTGILVMNIGTPESASTKDVGIYLKKFLMDEDVIPLPYIFRWILVNLIIVPFRSVKSAAKYAKIWTPQGSPLKVNTDNFVRKLQSELGRDYDVKIGMAFSEPSIKTSLAEFKNENVECIIACPMFPQYADATTGSVLKAVQKFSSSTEIYSIYPFYDQNFYIESLVQKCKSQKGDHWIFSYHGLPEKQLTKDSNCQLNTNCCSGNRLCYRSHCHKTTLAIAKALELKNTDYTMTFQSRLGAEKWLQPYTDEVLKTLPVKNISVVSPAFVADCLESLEEINLENRELFLQQGGQIFNYIPCLNDDSEWVKGFAEYIKDQKNIFKLV